jgi:hypothetical protein
VPQIDAIESIKKFDGAKYLYEKALTDTLEALGSTVSDETRADLTLSSFLG